MTTIREFNEVLLEARSLFRPMPWRVLDTDNTIDPYKVLVSELMLQQTQVSRVLPKYETFLKQFPTIQALSAAPLDAVLRSWNGLGYNRRAKYLHDAAKQLINAQLPWTYDALVACKGVGPNTAKAVLVYAYNMPEVFIETNVRTVFLAHFFANKKEVPDTDIVAKVQATIDKANPRIWYWSIMDMGAQLKSKHQGHLHRSVNHKKQPTFTGSRRQIRGIVLKQLAVKRLTKAQLEVVCSDSRLNEVLESLRVEGLLCKKDGYYYIGSQK